MLGPSFIGNGVPEHGTEPRIRTHLGIERVHDGRDISLG